MCKYKIMDQTLAKDIMTSDLISAQPTISVEDALKLLIQYRITGLPIVDQNGTMLGVLSEYDILAQVAEGNHKQERVFKNAIQFTEKVETISEDTPLEDLVDKFIQQKFRRLPVVNNLNKLVGIITRRDLMRVFYYRAQLEGLSN